MKKFFIAAFVLCSVFQLVNADGTEENDDRTIFDFLKNDKSALEYRVIKIEDEISEMKKCNKEDYLELLNNIGEVDEKFPDYVLFNLRDSGKFQKLYATSGCFFILAKDVQPYLDGFKVNFVIGNPYYATFSNPKIRLMWNESFSNYLKRKESKEKAETACGKKEKPISWWSSFHEKEYTIMKDLRPGAWNKIELVVSPATLEQIEYVKFFMDADQISLFKE